MSGRITIIVIVLALLLCTSSIHSQELWVGKDGNIRNVDTRAMVVASDAVYLATNKELYRASDVKSKWEEIFSLPSGDNEITCVNGNSRNFFIGTKRGLFRTQDGCRTWNNVFRTIIPEKNNIICIEISKYNKTVLIGTEKGVFISDDFGSRWQDISYNLKNKRITCIGASKDTIYVTTDDGLYSKKTGVSGWERMRVQNSALEETSQEEIPDNVETEGSSGSVACITFKGSRIYIGIDKKILYSDDNGTKWPAFSSTGLSGSINYILPSRRSDKLYCATSKGVFEYDKDKARWIELYKGMDKPYSVRSIVFESENERSMWAVTEGGLYKFESDRFASDQYIDVEKNLKSMKIMFDNEPSFKDLREAALKYGDVSPEKIKRWQRESRLKALVPKISVGTYKHIASNSEIYTSATRDYVSVGPDNITDGLDASVSWDLAGLIYGDDQTNIDVRSRLTTQLRNDILDDLRRVYFERKRLQFEMISSPPPDLHLRFEKELRIQELTQSIDDLTGNYLSEHIKKSNDSI